MVEHDKCTYFVVSCLVKYEMGMQKHSKNKEHGREKIIQIGYINNK
jgi:hypothetical protein